MDGDDQLGSPRVLVNTMGEVVSRRDFLPFGEEINSVEPASLRTDAALKYNGDGVRQKFTGYQKDDESGLDFAEARMYENRHGRFTAVDPLLASGKNSNPQTFNRYLYVLNNPLVLTDPTGLQVASWTGTVYTNGRTFGPEPFIGENSWPVEGAGIRFVDASDGYSYSYSESGSTLLGRTDDLNRRALGITSPPRSDISIFAASVNQGVDDGFTGILKGVGNAPSVALNGITHTFFNHAAGGLIFQGSNPLEVSLPFSAGNAREASYMSASSTGAIFGAGLSSGTIFGASSRLSVVPEIAPSTSAAARATQASTLEPGPFAVESIPARGPGPLNTAEQAQINAMGARNGCHNCGTPNPGTKSGNWIGDHQLPSKMIEPGTPQRIFPQCLGCSRRQGGDVRTFLYGPYLQNQ